jgi:hypothetical protein
MGGDRQRSRIVWSRCVRFKKNVNGFNGEPEFGQFT